MRECRKRDKLVKHRNRNQKARNIFKRYLNLNKKTSNGLQLNKMRKLMRIFKLGINNGKILIRTKKKQYLLITPLTRN
jgi:hypothetical protein